MRIYSIVMALHILAVLGAATVCGVVHAAQYQLMRTRASGEARLLLRGYRLTALFTPLLAAVFALGLVLMQIQEADRFHFSDGWVWTAMAAVVGMAIGEQAVLIPHGKRLRTALAPKPGDLAGDGRSLAAEPAPWALSYAHTGLAAAIVLTMVAKPATGLAIAVVLAGGGVGAAAGLALRNRVLASTAAAAV